MHRGKRRAKVRLQEGQVTADCLRTILQPDDPSFAEPSRFERNRTSRRGGFSLRGVPPGLWSVRVESADGRSWEGRVVVADHRRATLVLRE